MFEGERESGGRVRPVKFKTIGEDARSADKMGRQLERENGFAEESAPGESAAESLRRRRAAAADKPNFTLEFSYPAVALESVCFSVDKSQQQANFGKELLFRISNCLNPLFGGSSPEADQRVQILKSVNLNVPYGSIFGLLGPSSCGKTTLLRCLVGLLKPSSGSIRLFGADSNSARAADDERCCARCPGCFRGCRLGQLGTGGKRSRRASCKVPGANVGYMPQDLGLYEDFTIEQLLTMFGRYVRMESQLIKSRIAFMAEFLDLPHVEREIHTLSGGQKRRVSFAVACLHMPPLIILDEPTVGVDPLLRQSIWKYLRRLASEENKTIIITTHYIEEAAQADQVAFMRAGEILVQDTPARIMALNRSRSLEEAFLKICNNVQRDGRPVGKSEPSATHKLFPQPQFKWNELELELRTVSSPNHKNSNGNGNSEARRHRQLKAVGKRQQARAADRETVMGELKQRAEQKLALYERLQCSQAACPPRERTILDGPNNKPADGKPSMIPNACLQAEAEARLQAGASVERGRLALGAGQQAGASKTKRLRLLKRCKLTLNAAGKNGYAVERERAQMEQEQGEHRNFHLGKNPNVGDGDEKLAARLAKSLALFWALLYKNYRRNVNSIPLVAFQFMLPMIQMISFSLCVGGRPTDVGLGIVNHEQPLSFDSGAAAVVTATATDDLLSLNGTSTTLDYFAANDSLSARYLSFVDREMLHLQAYKSLHEALADVRRAKLWAVLEIGANFSAAISRRFDLDNFYQLDRATIGQSVIKIYPDRSNKILDMICHRSLMDSYRRFLSSEFDHFKRLPIEVARPIFDIKPNVISNSIDGYTESIAPGLLASLTYIMAAGLTTFIMVVERSAGILERTYTSGISPVAYLLAHALFRSLVMMLQIAAVLVLTFHVLQQPIVGSIWLAYAQLMVLNMTGIAYGLLISSLVTDQNGAALTIVSSLVVKITLSGILWPAEAIPRWLRLVCFAQPLAMPVQALKAITLKGAKLGDRAVNLGFLVSIFWMVVFLTISAKRFKFYQH